MSMRSEMTGKGRPINRRINPQILKKTMLIEIIMMIQKTKTNQ